MTKLTEFYTVNFNVGIQPLVSHKLIKLSPTNQSGLPFSFIKTVMKWKLVDASIVWVKAAVGEKTYEEL